MKNLHNTICRVLLGTAFVSVPAQFAGAADGSSASSPSYISATDAILDDGGSATYYYGVNANVDYDGPLYVGMFNKENVLSISDSYSVTDTAGYIGLFGASSGAVTVDAAEWTHSGDFVTGASGEGSLTVQSGAAFSAVNLTAGLYATSTGTIVVTGDASTLAATGSLMAGFAAPEGSINMIAGTATVSKDVYLGVLASATGTMTLSGSDTELSTKGDFYCGASGSGLLNVEESAKLRVGGDFYAGVYDGSSAEITVTGSSSALIVTGALHAGSDGSATILASDGAFILAGSVDTSSGGTVVLDNATLAIKGQYSASQILSMLNLKVVIGGATVSATQDNITTSYSAQIYYTTGEADDTFLPPEIDLSGYTVVTVGASDLSWADPLSNKANWVTSTWYGVFYWYADDDFVWHMTHGWQYAYPTTGTDVYLWDYGTNSWWFTSADLYPYVYMFAKNAWFYYQSGASPDRLFWDYGTGSQVNESAGF